MLYKCSILTFFCLFPGRPQDEKNQILTTNVWLNLVSTMIYQAIQYFHQRYILKSELCEK